MEKLIKLLLIYKPQQQYIIGGPLGEYNSEFGIGWYKREGDFGGWFSNEIVISKRFGFIKWLVDNDKIEVTNIWILPKKLYINNDGITCVDDMCEDCYYNAYESLLMLLAIQDEPIEFLISILK